MATKPKIDNESGYNSFIDTTDNLKHMSLLSRSSTIVEDEDQDEQPVISNLNSTVISHRDSIDLSKSLNIDDTDLSKCFSINQSLEDCGYVSRSVCDGSNNHSPSQDKHLLSSTLNSSVMNKLDNNDLSKSLNTDSLVGNNDALSPLEVTSKELTDTSCLLVNKDKVDIPIPSSKVRNFYNGLRRIDIMTLLSEVPPILKKVTSFINLNTLKSMRLVSRSWRQVVNAGMFQKLPKKTFKEVSTNIINNSRRSLAERTEDVLNKSVLEADFKLIPCPLCGKGSQVFKVAMKINILQAVKLNAPSYAQCTSDLCRYKFCTNCLTNHRMGAPCQVRKLQTPTHESDSEKEFDIEDGIKDLNKKTESFNRLRI